MREPVQGGGSPEEKPVEPDVVEVRAGTKTIVLVGTAHISRESADLVRRVIDERRPDRVCVELDAQRLQALEQREKWRDLDIKKVIKNRQLATLLVNLLLASYQRKLGQQLGVPPGTELLEAVEAAREGDVPVTLCDRPIRATMLRAWRSMSMWQQMKLLGSVLAGILGDVEVDEASLRELRQGDVLSELMEELAREMPDLKRVLIDERDAYMADAIRSAEGETIVAVVGAGHLQGIRTLLESDHPVDREALQFVPRVSPMWKVVGYGVPVVVLGSLVVIAAAHGGELAGQKLAFWILANGIPSAIGSVLALAHPVTIAAAFVAAPITSLTPVIGAGYVTAFVQSWVCPPRVADFETLADDAARFPAWWRNRLLRVLLAFVLPGLGSMVGTWIGGAEIIRGLFGE